MKLLDEWKVGMLRILLVIREDKVYVDFIYNMVILDNK